MGMVDVETFEALIDELMSESNCTTPCKCDKCKLTLILSNSERLVAAVIANACHPHPQLIMENMCTMFILGQRYERRSKELRDLESMFKGGK